MQNDTNTVKEQVWESLTDKAYRDALVSSHLATNVASQIYSLRESQGWTQKDLAIKTGMAQTRISVLENPEYDNFKIDTLKRIASAFDVALIVRFVPFSELVEWMTTPNPSKLVPIEYIKDRLPPPSVNYAIGYIFPTGATGAYVPTILDNTSSVTVFQSDSPSFPMNTSAGVLAGYSQLMDSTTLTQRI